ncbi:MAG: hypothetical protein FWG81_10830 [Betaproteobacteria bacterium]|nr:hypothetical protein [Betaproteobacteria bacterium]
MAFIFAIFATIVTLIGFSFARKIESNIISTLTKHAALAVGFLSMPAIAHLFKIEGTQAAGGYWVYMMIGIWVLSKIFGGSRHR